LQFFKNKHNAINLLLWISLLSTTFIVTPFLWNPTVTGKYFYFAFVVAAAGLVVAYRIFKQGTFRLNLSDLVLFCFAGWVLVSCVINGTHLGMKLWLFMLLVSLYLIIRVTLNRYHN